MKRSRQHPVWTYFTVSDDNRYSFCNNCGNRLSGVLAQNAMRHLASCNSALHLRLLEAELLLPKKIKSNTQTHLPEQPRFKIVEVKRKSNLNLNSTGKPEEWKPSVSKFSDDELKSQQKLFCKLLVQPGVDLDFFTTTEFTNFIKNYDKRYEIPKSCQEMEELIKNYSKNEEIENLLNFRGSKISLVLNKWKKNDETIFLIVNGHFFTFDWNYHQITLAIEVLEKNNDENEEIQRKLKKVMEEYKFFDNDIGKIVADFDIEWKNEIFEQNGQSIKVEVTENLESEFQATSSIPENNIPINFSTKSIPCLGKLIDKMMTNAIDENPEIFNPISKLKNFEIFENDSEVALPLNSEWIQNFQRARNFKTLNQESETEKYVFVGKEEILNFINCVEPIYNFLLKLQSEEPSQICSVFADLIEIREFLKNSKENLSGIFAEIILNQFNIIFNHFLDPKDDNFNPLYIIAALISPSEAVYLHIIEREILIDIINKECSLTNDIEKDSEITILSTNLSFRERIKAKIPPKGVTKSPSEFLVDSFRNREFEDESTIDYWKNPSTTLEILKNWAYTILSIQPIALPKTKLMNLMMKNQQNHETKELIAKKALALLNFDKI